MKVSPRHWPSSWMAPMLVEWMPDDRVRCGGYRGTILRQFCCPIAGPNAFEVKMDGWSFPVVLSQRQMDMFARMTG